MTMTTFGAEISSKTFLMRIVRPRSWGTIWKMQKSQGIVSRAAKVQKANHCRKSTMTGGHSLATWLGRGNVTTIMGRKMHLASRHSEHAPYVYACRGPRHGETYRSRKKAVPMKTARTLTVQCSAFWKTFHKQYMKAATHKNHSRKAANMTRPTMLVKTICAFVSGTSRRASGVIYLVHRPRFPDNGSHFDW